MTEEQQNHWLNRFRTSRVDQTAAVANRKHISELKKKSAR